MHKNQIVNLDMLYEDKLINLNQYLKERIIYFELIVQQKNISLSMECSVSVSTKFNTTK